MLCFTENETPWSEQPLIIEIMDFTAENWLSRIICSEIFPISHASNIWVVRAYMLYAQVNDVSIDFGSHFCKVVVDFFCL
jgi:hypothetical protein